MMRLTSIALLIALAACGRKPKARINPPNDGHTWCSVDDERTWFPARGTWCFTADAYKGRK